MPFNGDMLRLARQRRGLQQTEAAAKLGVTQPLLSRYENGLAEPREPFVIGAARLYRVLPGFFEQKEPVYGAPVSVHPMWRRRTDVSARDLDRVVAELNIRSMHLRRFLEAADVATERSLPRLDMDEYGNPERIAALVRAHWGAPSGPLGNLVVLAERAGLLVAHSDFGGAHVSGVTFAKPGTPPLVLLNASQPGDRLRFTLAHEIGHLVMHRFPTPDMEREANAFASALLMPARDLRPSFAARKPDLPLLAALKPEWRVSMQALLMRAKSMGLLDRNREEYLWKQMGARGYRLREPPELDIPAEVPTVVPSLARVFQSSLELDRARMAELLHLPAPELEDFYGPEVRPSGTRPRLRVVD